MSDKSFKIKSGLIVPALSTAGIVKTDSSGVISSSATLAISEGGTGQTTAANALNALLPLQTSNTNYFLQTNGVTPQWTQVLAPIYSSTAPSSPATGQVWVDSSTDTLSFDPNIIRRSTFTATAGQTVFTTSVNFVDGYEQVYFNGMLLLKTTDYTTSNNNTITLTSAAALNDIVEVVTVTNLNSVNTYTQSEINGYLADKKTEISSAISSNTNLAVGYRYFVTSASTLTLTLPSNPSINNQIDIFDASGNASTYNITIARNGKLINGNAGNFIIDVNGSWYTLVFTGNTYGWKVA